MSTRRREKGRDEGELEERTDKKGMRMEREKER